LQKLELAMSYTFTTLGSPSSSATGYQYTGVNGSGEMVGWYTDSSGDDFGLLYNGSTYTSLTEPSAQGSPPVVTKAFGINDNGQVVGYYVSLDPLVAQGNNQFGFQYSGGTYTSLPWPPNNPPGSASVAEATGINKAGQIVGWYQPAGGIEHSFLYSGGSYTVFDAPGGTGSTYAEGINDNGQIVGYYTDAYGVTHGFLYTISNGSYTTLDDPSEGSGGATYAYGINDSGQIVGYYAVPAEAGTLAFGFFPNGFMYSGGTFTTIDDPAGSNTEIFGISNSGAIVGSFTGGSFVATSSSQR
jgi:probable HAF family extracellular repeat protein